MALKKENLTKQVDADMKTRELKPADEKMKACIFMMKPSDTHTFKERLEQEDGKSFSSGVREAIFHYMRARGWK